MSLEERISIWLFESRHCLVFLELFSPGHFWSMLSSELLGSCRPWGFWGAVHRGAFWELSTQGLFGALHHFDF